MKIKKIPIFFLLAILLQLFDTVSTMDSHNFAENKMLLPRNSNNLSIKTHWQYIGYYLYKLLYENDSFSEATKTKIDKIFGINQKIINQLGFIEDENIRSSIYRLDLSGVFFSDVEISEEDIDEPDSNGTQDSEKQTGDEREDGDTAFSSKGSDSEEAKPTEIVASEEKGDGVASTIMTLPAEVSTEVTLPSDTNISATVTPDQSLTTDVDVSGEVPLYDQMGVQNAAFPSGYNSLSDPNMVMQQQENMAGEYNFGYNTTGDRPMYNNVGQQSYENSYSDRSGLPMYGSQTYNSGMGTANYGNGYNNMSDFQRNDQNMGMYQQQNGMQNSYGQVGDSQYNQYGGMTQGSEGMPQYGQQIQSYGNTQQQQFGEYPPDYQYQGDMNAGSAEDMPVQQMEQQQNQMQGYPSTEDGVREQQMRLQSEGRVVEEEQSRPGDMENREIRSSSEMQSVDETAEATRQVGNQETDQQQLRNGFGEEEAEQQQVSLPSQEVVQNVGDNETTIVKSQPHSEKTTIAISQQDSTKQRMTVDSVSSSSQSTLRKDSGVQLQLPSQEQSSSYTISQRTATGESWSSGSEIQPSSIVEAVETMSGSTLDGAEWNSQRGSSTWGVIDNETPPKFDPNAPLTSEDF